jgi:hypothetical protein
MLRCLLVTCVLLPACARPPAPRPPREERPAAVDAAVPVADTPAVARVAPEVGRWSVVVDKEIRAVHARNHYRETTRVSLVLELGQDGAATACRGHSSQSSNSGPKVDRVDRTREQQGYQGTWQATEDGLVIDLVPADTPCSQERAYTNLAPGWWHLTCRIASVTPAAPPALVCQLANGQLTFEEGYGLNVPVAGGRAIVLGQGNGLRVSWTEDAVPPAHVDPEVTIEVAPVRVENDTWQR